MTSSAASRLLRPAVALPLSFLFLQFQSPRFLKYLFAHPESLSGAALLDPLRFAGVGILAGLFLLGAVALGDSVLKRFWRPGSAPERLAGSLVLGEGIIGFSLMALGLGGFFSRPLLIGVFVLISAGGLWRYRNKAPGLSTLWSAAVRPVRPLEFFLLCLLFLGFWRALIATAAPPTDWDSLAYHLAFPKIFLTEGRLLRLPWSINAHYPLNAEMLYTLGLAVQGDVLCHWLNFAHGVALAAVAAAVGTRYFSRRAGWAAAAVLVVQPVFQRVIGNASTDLAAALPLVLAAACAAEAGTSAAEARRNWGMAGVLTGLAASVKLTGLWMAPALLGLLLARVLLGGPHRLGAVRRLGQEAGMFLLGAAATGFPWYLRNLWTTGNPVWPYAASILGGGPSAAAAWARIAASVTERVPFNLAALLSLPWKFWSAADLFKYQPYFLTTPFFFLFFLRLFRRPSLSAAPKAFLGALGLFALVWLAVYPAWRYALPVAAGLAVFVAGFFEESVERSRARWAWIPVAVFPLIPLKSLSVNAESFPFWGLRSLAAPDLSSRDRYCELTLGDPFTLAREANARLPTGARVLMYKDVRGYYLDRPYAWGDPLNPGVLDFHVLNSPEDVGRELHRLGFTHIVYNPFIEPFRGDRSYYDRADRLMADFLIHRGRALSMRGGGGLFSISGEPLSAAEGDSAGRRL